MIKVHKKRGESLSRMMGRFRRVVEQSGILLEAKKRRFFQKKKNTRSLKGAALQREKIRQYKEILRRRGELGPDDRIDGKIDLNNLPLN